MQACRFYQSAVHEDDNMILLLDPSILQNLIFKGPGVVSSSIRVVATTPRKDPQPNISDLRDHSQSIFRPILTRIQKKKVATPIY